MNRLLPEHLVNGFFHRTRDHVSREPAGWVKGGIDKLLPVRVLLPVSLCGSRVSKRLLAVLWLLLVNGCGDGEHVQSVLHPAGPAAAKIAWLWWIMFSILTTVFVIVILALLLAVFRPTTGTPEEPPLGNKFIIISGIILPGLILVVLLFFSLETLLAVRGPESGVFVPTANEAMVVGGERFSPAVDRLPPFATAVRPITADDPLTIHVTGHQWWWEVHYPLQEITTANEIYIPVGQRVRVELLSADVIHSFWVPRLHGKMDMLAGHANTFWIEASRPGTYRGQCAEFCGLQHALMAFMLVAVPPDEFNQWLEDRQRPHPQPETELLQRGEQVFFEAACDNCHAIRGTRAKGKIGPDLTHMGTRLTVGAGWLDNTHGTLAGWIANPQAIKPGNRMPRSYLRSNDLEAVTSYLLSLE